VSTNLEKLTQAGIVGTSHAITPEDHPLVESLTDDEVNTLIAIKAKLNPTPTAADASGPQPVGTVSF
jgi:Na+-translocating ferredoxin:NAD+ oxidoreductase RnfC subunit